jgi:hypothetical protein
MAAKKVSADIPARTTFTAAVGSRRRDGIERVGYINPGTHLRCLRHTREEGKRDRGSPGALGTDQFADRPHRQTTLQDFIQRCDSVAATGRIIFGAGVSAEGIFCARTDSI